MSNRFSFSFNILEPTEIIVVPEKKSIMNEFDFIGTLVSVPRIEGESNRTYKQRIMDASVNPGDPTYNGIINNITRDLGLTRGNALTIELKLASSGEPIAPNPRVDVLADKVTLYKDWKVAGDSVVDKEIKIYNPTDEGYYLKDLIVEINSSECFSATAEDNVRPNLHSTNLILASSDNALQNDLVEASDRIKLTAGYIIEDSLVFDETAIFKNKVESLANPGDYIFDNINGVIYPYSIPSGTYGISYHYEIFPLVVRYSMVKIYSLQDDNFNNELYQHEIADSGEEENTLLNTEGAEIYHQLFKDMKVFWGE